jgi:hypothetical protein
MAGTGEREEGEGEGEREPHRQYKIRNLSIMTDGKDFV